LSKSASVQLRVSLTGLDCDSVQMSTISMRLSGIVGLSLVAFSVAQSQCAQDGSGYSYTETVTSTTRTIVTNWCPNVSEQTHPLKSQRGDVGTLSFLLFVVVDGSPLLSFTMPVALSSCNMLSASTPHEPLDSCLGRNLLSF